MQMSNLQVRYILTILRKVLQLLNGELPIIQTPCCFGHV